MLSHRLIDKAHMVAIGTAMVERVQQLYDVTMPVVLGVEIPQCEQCVPLGFRFRLRNIRCQDFQGHKMPSMTEDL